MIVKRVKSGQWIRVLPAVYAMASAPRTWRQRLMAAVLWAGPEAVASHRAAARLWGLDGAPGEVVEITSPRDLRHGPGWVVAHKGTATGIDRATRDGIPVTSVSRNLIDLGAVVDDLAVELAVDHAIRDGLSSVDFLWKCLDGVSRRGRDGAGVIKRVLRQRDPSYVPSDSKLSLMLLRIVRRYGLPEPVKQHPFTARGEQFRIDLCYPSLMIALEADGFRWHDGNRPDFDRDRHRRNLLTLAGWRVLHFTWTQMRDRPWEVAAEISAALSS